MKVIIFGASGMVGQGVLRECLQAPDVDTVLAIGRAALSESHPKLRQLVKQEPCRLDAEAAQFDGFDACFFCLGVSSAGMSEERYAQLTHDMTLQAAQTLARSTPPMSFVYVSGAGTDSTERGASMWARVKGRTENALLRLPFKGAYMFRPGIIQPLDGIRSKTASYRLFYSAAKPLLWLARRVMPRAMLTTESMGLAMLEVARHGAPQHVLEVADIQAIVRAATASR